MKKVTLVCDLQFGSTGKGLIAGYIAERDQPDTVVTAWSANAGHTYVDANGRKFIHTMLANGVVSRALKQVMIAPGSQLNLASLEKELTECRDLFKATGAVVLIHQNATVISERHVLAEGGSMVGNGSTRKGCGAALAEKISRQIEFRRDEETGAIANTLEPIWCNAQPIVASDFGAEIDQIACRTGVQIYIVGQTLWMDTIYAAEKILVEGAQGYSLGMNSGFYPFTTSRECTPAQIMSDCAIPLEFLKTVVGTLRTFPIRVSNRYDEAGNMVGWSGPGYPDQEELSFKDINQEQELTTVTKLPRRIFSFSTNQLVDAVMHVRPDEIFINFINYTTPIGADAITMAIEGMAEVQGKKIGIYYGVGPTINDVLTDWEEVRDFFDVDGRGLPA